MSEYIIDEQGKWLIQGSARLLIEPSESYLAERQREAEEEANRLKEPTIDDYLLELDFRLSSIELGI